MCARALLSVAFFVLAIGSPMAHAQGDNQLPTVTIADWFVARAPVSSVAPQFFQISPPLGQRISDFVHHERDFITARMVILDPDWSLPPAEGEEGQENREAVYFRTRLFSHPDTLPCLGFVTFSDVASLNATALSQPPTAPPIGFYFADILGEFEFIPFVAFPMAEWLPGSGAGIAPFEDPTAPNGLAVEVWVSFQLPQIIGENQTKLRGLIDYDTAYRYEFATSNNQSPDPDRFEITCAVADIKLAISPYLRPPTNPRPFADAGADRTVAAGRTIVLDASGTFDGSNVGFNPESENVFAKDRLTFTWSWEAGPERFDPIQDSPFDPTARVTLNMADPDRPYVFRVTVSDNVNPQTSSDTVSILVLEPSQLLPNRRPRAAITGPTEVTRGTVVELSAEQSTDPDGDTLSFRWTQVNELGLPIASSELLEAFQPLTGMNQPVVAWQANRVGTYFVRLVASDGDLSASVTTTIRVVPGPADNTPVTVDDSTSSVADGTGEESADPPAVAAPLAGMCGAAGLVPLAALPLLMALGRRRLR